MKAICHRVTCGATVFATALLLGSVAHGDPLVCQRAIVKASAKFAQTATKTLGKCEERKLKGDLPPGTICGLEATASAKLARAESKLLAALDSRCGGADGGCGTGDDESLFSIGWPSVCPGLEGMGCTNAIADCADIAVCLACIDRAAVYQATALSYGNLAASSPGSDLNRCQIAIGKGTARFFQTKSKLLQKCEDRVLTGTVVGPCPDAVGTAPLIIQAAAREAQKICGACGGSDRVCGDGDDLTREAIGFVDNCPAVTVPAGTACGGDIGSLQDLVDCVGCVNEFKADCLDALEVPALKPYPPECVAPVSTPTPTPTFTPSPCDASTPTATPTPTPAPGCGNGVIDVAEDCDPPGSATCPNAGNGLELCNGACQCACPSRIEIAPSEGSLTALDDGWTGQGHDLPAFARNAELTVGVTGCANPHKPCGVCNFAGPVPNADLGAGTVHNRRCAGDTGRKCSYDCDCATVGGPCSFYFGSYTSMAIYPKYVCVSSHVTGSITGTANIDTGAIAATIPLTSVLVVSGTNVCPTCVGDALANDGLLEGLCMGGPHDGLPCDVNGSTNVQWGATSLDCPPTTSIFTTTAIDSTITSSTNTVTRTLSAENPSCRATGFTDRRCFCDTCNNAAATICATNADCEAVGATICGSKRCRGGTNNWGVCTVSGSGSECPGGGVCSLPGGFPTAPNQCSDDICTPTSGSEGECASGPFEQFCGPTAIFKPCTVDAECASYKSCDGSANAGAFCAANSECPGGSCNAERCVVGRNRPCYVDQGRIGTRCYGGTNDPSVTTCTTLADCPDQGSGTFCGGGSVSAVGTATPPTNDQWDATLPALSCVGPSLDGSANGTLGFPGLVRIELPLHVRSLP